MEGIRKLTTRMKALLHPSRAADVLLGVREVLNSLILRFNSEYEGVILCYEDVRILGRTAKILSGLAPHFHVDVVTTLLLFSPKPGMMIEGKVNKIEKDYIGAIVLGVFNTTIGVTDIREDFDCTSSKGGRRAWVSTSDTRHAIVLGSLIRFSVKSLQETEHIINICGSLLESNTGCVEWLDRDFTSRRKRPKEANLRSSSEHEDKGHKKKSKKDRSQADAKVADHYSQPIVESDPIGEKKAKVPKHAKRTDVDGLSPSESKHNFKRKKKEALA